MSSERERAFGATLGRIGCLLAAALLLVGTLFVIMFRGGSGEFVEREGLAYMLIGGETVVFDDRDGDGAIDCLLQTGVSGPRYRADGYDGRCGIVRPGDPRSMSDAMRQALGRLAKDKLALEATHLSCVDLDRDRETDCVVNAHNPQLVLYRNPAGRCPGDGGELLDAKRLRAFDRLLAQEAQIREWVSRDSGAGNAK